jgi:uncharacterized membrane protein
MTDSAVKRVYWKEWAAAFGLTLLPVLLASAPPFLSPSGRVLIMMVFEPFCHQMPARSPHLWGVQLAVGHRIYGMLLGFPFGAVAFAVLLRHDPVLRRWAPQILAVTTLPMAVDWALGWFGLWPNSALSRMLTGGLFGVAAGYWLTRAILQALR